MRLSNCGVDFFLFVWGIEQWKWIWAYVTVGRLRNISVQHPQQKVIIILPSEIVRTKLIYRLQEVLGPAFRLLFIGGI